MPPSSTTEPREQTSHCWSCVDLQNYFWTNWS